jgi:hypothetical protein
MAEDRERPWDFPRIRQGYLTPELISGTVLVSVVIAVADERDGIRDVFAVTVASVFVFWSTQIFVTTIALQRRRGDDEPIRLRESAAIAFRRASGLLLAAIPPLLFLLFGVVFGVNEGAVAYWIALWLGVVLLAALGWIAFAGRGIPWYWRGVGSLATAGFGLLAIGLRILVS